MVRKSTEEARNCDNGIKTAIQLIGEGEGPVQNNLADRSQTVLSLWAQRDRLVVRDGLLYRKWESRGGQKTTLQLIIPRHPTDEVLRAPHDAPSAGHFGYRKTLLRVRQRFYWPGMSRDVEEWCRRCDRCASR
jgi:hypothetical protein